MISIEQLRDAINRFLLDANDVLYGWRVAAVDVWGQGLHKWLILLLVAALIVLVWLVRVRRRHLQEVALLRSVTEGVGQASSPGELLSLAFRTVFSLTGAPAACVYIAHAAGAPLLLRGKEDNPDLSEREHPEWDPRSSLEQAPAVPSIAAAGRLMRVSIPISIDGDPLVLLEMGAATAEAADKLMRGSDRVSLLLTPILAKLAWLVRLERLEERSREASIVSGSSQALLSTTLAPDQQAAVLLDLTVRATESAAGLVLVDRAAVGIRSNVLASTGLDRELLQNLTGDGSPRLLHHGGVMALSDAVSGPAAVLTRAGFRSAIEAPINVDGTSIGCLVLLRRDGEFQAHHLRIGSLNATRLALSLKNRTYHAAVFGEYRETLRAMVVTYESTAAHLRGHSRRVARLCEHVATALGLAAAEVEGIRLAGDLHDVGMVGLGTDIVLRPGRLTSQEFDLVKHHPAIGGSLTAPIRMPVPIGPLVLHHHERFDGGGYPAGLKGADIPLGARILALGEVFDAMVTSRSYREALPFSQAVTRLRSLGGSQLDPAVVEVFLATVTVDRWRAIERESHEPE